MKRIAFVMLCAAGVAMFALQGPSLLITAEATSQNKGKATGGAGAVYTAQCAKCHAADGKGIASLGEMPNFTDGAWQSSRTDKQISDGISNGAGVMPGFKESLSAAQISALVKHVRAFGPAKGKK
jgi:mono/diheme cytochrome c family protein